VKAPPLKRRFKMPLRDDEKQEVFSIIKEEISRVIKDIEKKIREENQAEMKEAETKIEKGMFAISEKFEKRLKELEREIALFAKEANKPEIKKSKIGG
jgi:hypothetical protein